MVDVLLQIAEDPTLEVKLERDGVKAFTLYLFQFEAEISNNMSSIEMRRDDVKQYKRGRAVGEGVG
ncbi:cytochrome P450 71A1-like [Senna tora]|uniref:Cytochrome P450 71A1-like n=1 Tax=Senna tora TaxID=362788 RepID=A0A834T2T5_9FABA|nr:cytochrome P450 71A1-like [Senna tora]